MSIRELRLKVYKWSSQSNAWRLSQRERLSPERPRWDPLRERERERDQPEREREIGLRPYHSPQPPFRDFSSQDRDSLRHSRHKTLSRAHTCAYVIVITTLFLIFSLTFSTFNFLAYLDLWFLTLTFDFLDFWQTSLEHWSLRELVFNPWSPGVERNIGFLMYHICATRNQRINGICIIEGFRDIC